ncbi:hypothetical protein K1719_012244 [Acacia pycnantha]|nr:hypothetical protein K1719_012244 [Acacia pycnantha]
MTTSVEEVASSFNYKETKKEGGRVVLDPVSKLPAPTSSSFQSSEKTEKEVVRIQTSQLSIDPTWTDSENAKETTKGIDENATATCKSPMAIPFMRALCLSLHDDYTIFLHLNHLQIISVATVSQIVDAGTSFSKLEICEIFKLAELKHGEMDLLAQELEQYPQLLLPREHRTYGIIAWSYRVLVDILVMLATKTPNTITPFEKSTLEANLNEAIVLGFDKDCVEFVHAKAFGVDMSNVSKAKEEIQVMEVKLREIDSKLLGLSEDRKKVIVNMNMFRDIVNAKDKPFGF